MLNQESTTDLVVMASNSNSNLTQKAKQMNEDIIEFMRKRSRADPLCHAKYTTLVALGRKRQKAMRARREPPTLRPSLYTSKKRNAEDQDVRAPPSAAEPAPVERRRSDQHAHSHSQHHAHLHDHSPPEDRRRHGGSDHCQPKRRKPKCGKAHRRRRSSRRDPCKKRRHSRRRSKCKPKHSRRRSKNRCKKPRRHRSRKCKPKKKRRC